MELTIEGTTHAGEVVDLREHRVDRAALVAAIRGAPSPYAIECPTPGPVHGRAGVVTPSMGLKTRTALAAAARSQGIGTSHDDRIDALAADLATLSAAIERDRPTDGARTGGDGPPDDEIARLRERAAELRGQVTALADGEGDPTDARAELRETAAELAELETRRVAARQRRERARERRDRRERRLRLEDRLANARRDARAELVDAVRPAYERAVTVLQDGATGDDAPADPFAVPAPVAALAVFRVGVVRAPVVLGTDRPGEPDRAADWLDAPVIRL